ncbi:helix-turn-helix domain-containing protein (plasmid) [Rhizobium sp. RCAM05350]|nr:helix-turn-helix domain-containing protein [Rhizobium sp. RCAM05350]
MGGKDGASVSSLLETLVGAEEFSLRDFEQSVYRAALERAGGNLSAAARLLGLTRPQLAYRVNGQNDSKPERTV